MRDIGARLREAGKLGFTRAIVPRTAHPPVTQGIEVIEAARIEQALELVRGMRSPEAA